MYIAIDVGGTKTAFAKIDKLDKPTISGKETISTPQTYDEAIVKIYSQIEKFSKWQKVEGISIALPGSVSNEKIELLTNLPDWNHKPLLEDVSKKFKTKVIMRNDAVATARAERYFGLAKNENRYLYCIIGTGFGATYVHRVGDKFLELPLEPEYMIVNSHGTHRNHFHTPGLLGAYATGAVIQEKTGIHSLASLEDSDPIWDEMVQYLGIGLNNLITLFKPPVIIFSGGIIVHRKFLLKLLRMELAKYVEYLPQPNLKITEFGDDASLYGAISLLYELQ
ncbi:ROK family protein [Candidatus Dojkabacteria bacterium]|uniref:ROK family protein n=1 Tax=Candidatus Dojkabacteria bacterium TaxID=2099670 RepID=A0A955I645_9BACT|nr:ROK family protein [Candidatus Dojkabacteria bacterium]